MPNRLWLKAAESAEEERQMIELNASLEREARREKIAIDLARVRYAFNTDDVEITHEDYPTPVVESVDGGYWVRARVWIYADDVEERME